MSTARPVPYAKCALPHEVQVLIIVIFVVLLVVCVLSGMHAAASAFKRLHIDRDRRKVFSRLATWESSTEAEPEAKRPSMLVRPLGRCTLRHSSQSQFEALSRLQFSIPFAFITNHYSRSLLL